MKYLLRILDGPQALAVSLEGKDVAVSPLLLDHPVPSRGDLVVLHTDRPAPSDALMVLVSHVEYHHELRRGSHKFQPARTEVYGHIVPTK